MSLVGVRKSGSGGGVMIEAGAWNTLAAVPWWQVGFPRTLAMDVSTRTLEQPSLMPSEQTAPIFVFRRSLCGAVLPPERRREERIAPASIMTPPPLPDLRASAKDIFEERVG